MIIEDKEAQVSYARAIGSPEFETETDADFKDLLMASFRTDNMIGSYLAQEDGLPGGAVDPDFNPFDYFTEEEKVDEVFIEAAALADNTQEIDAVRRQRDREQKDRLLLNDAGGDAIAAGLVAAIVDPINLIPVGGVTYKTYRTGGDILQAGMVTAGVAAGTTAAQEAALHYSQIERTYEESAVNMGLSTFMGLTLGSGAAAFSNALDKKLNGDVLDSLNPEPKIAKGQDSVGAARVFEDVRIKGKAAENLTKLLSFDPLSRSLTSQAQATRNVSAMLAESPIAFEGGMSGNAVETLIKLHDGKYFEALQGHLDNFKLYRKSGGTMNRRQYNEAVSKEMRNPKTDNKFIKSSAEFWRTKLYDPLKEQAIKADLLPEDVQVDTAVSYLNRVWDKNKIAANLDEFVVTTSRWLKSEQPDADIDYDELAREIGTRIMSTPDGRLPYDYKIGENSRKNSGSRIAKAGVFKERSFMIPDEMVEAFLENDIETLGGRYLRGVAPQIEMINRFGDLEMTNEIKEIAQEWDDLIQAASKTDPKKAVQLRKKKDADIRDIAGMRDRILGTYGEIDPENIFVRMGRTARDLNYMRLMGGVVASSIPDIARIVMSEGFASTFNNGLRPMIGNLKGFKVSAAEAKQYGIGVDVLMGGRSEIIADIADYTQGGTAFERGVRSATQSFSKINLMDFWTAGTKQLHIVTMQNRLIPMLKKGEYDPRLKQLGIDEADAANIGKQLKKYSTKVDGVNIANAKNWDEPNLMEMWGAALRKESDSVILVPGQEKPLFMSSEMGKTFFQFKTFMFSATQRIMIAGLQHENKNFIGGLASMISMAMMAYAFKQWDADRPISDDPKVWLTEGIDRSGALGILMEVNNTVEKVSANNYGLRPMLGVSAPASRFASRSNYEAALGPTFGSLLSTTFRVAGAATSEGEMKDSDIRAIRRLLPYQNLMIFRQGLDKIEETLE